MALWRPYRIDIIYVNIFISITYYINIFMEIKQDSY